jgi:hypothetical protein
LTVIQPARKARDPTDAEVNAVIELYPDGAPLPVIADLLGTSHERARQIVANSLAKALMIFKARRMTGECILPDDRDQTEQGIGFFGDSYDGSH